MDVTIHPRKSSERGWFDWERSSLNRFMSKFYPNWVLSVPNTYNSNSSQKKPVILDEGGEKKLQ